MDTERPPRGSIIYFEDFPRGLATLLAGESQKSGARGASQRRRCRCITDAFVLVGRGIEVGPHLEELELELGNWGSLQPVPFQKPVSLTGDHDPGVGDG